MILLRHRDSDEITYDTDTIYELRDPTEIPDDTTDVMYRAKTGETLRDIAFAVYGEARWWWVLADLNRIVNPFDPVRPDKIVRCPARGRIQDYVL